MDFKESEINHYFEILKNTNFQKVYKSVIDYLRNLKSYLEKKYSDYVVSSLYLGYLDMTYFSFTPKDLKDKGLKVAIVLLHQEERIELWLSGINKKVQSEYIDKLKEKDLKGLKLSIALPGVDSIIEKKIVEKINLIDIESLNKQIEKETMSFINFMKEII